LERGAAAELDASCVEELGMKRKEPRSDWKLTTSLQIARAPRIVHSRIAAAVWGGIERHPRGAAKVPVEVQIEAERGLVDRIDGDVRTGDEGFDDREVDHVDAGVVTAVDVFAQHRIEPYEDIVGRAVRGKEGARKRVVGKRAPPVGRAVRTLGDPLVCLLHATRSAFHTA